MAVATYNIQYLGSVSIKANKTYKALSFLSQFPTADCFMLKTKANNSEPVKVSINSTPYFEINYMEVSAYDGTSNLSYTFNRDCTIVMWNTLQVN